MNSGIESEDSDVGEIKMINKQQIFQSYGMKVLQISVFVFAFFLMNTTANAQTALEQQCFNDVQGKVAWDQAGNKTWGEINLRNLCRGTTNPSATISCFQAQISQHNDWNKGISACLPEKSATTLPNKIQEEKTAIVRPAEIENVRTVTFRNNAHIQATLTVGTASSGQLNIGESATANIKESIGTPLLVGVTMKIPNQLFVIYSGIISDDNRATSFCFEAKGDVMKPSVQPCDGTQVTEMRKIEFKNEAGFHAKSTLNYFVNGSPKSISTDDTSLGVNRVLYIPLDADKDKDITLSTTSVNIGWRHKLPDIKIDRNSRSSLCYKVWGPYASPKFNPCSLSQSARTIKFKNNGAFTAILHAVFDSPNKVVSNYTSLLESDVQEIPRVITVKPIEVFIEIDTLFSGWKRFFTTTVAADFKGELCFKAEGTSFNPTASTCDDTVGDASSGNTRQIKFLNDGAYDAQAVVMYFEYQTIGGTKVSMPKTITTGFINGLGKSRMITLPKDVVQGTIIQIFLQGNATLKNDIWSTTLPADFNGSPVPCFKVWGSLFNPEGGKCNQ